eukprot:TRINITY_DN4576_c1_g1_i1.p1 TRINITY_DN4576_c1_g1~~TRINITY_DN4576_c1_g1_i1.p1  ORF type:complete len:338 (+),score=104.91 TRINITY_DN4576_c1_g1_i1:61-1014(+)
MGERKVLNKYYPPDFDPTLIPRTKRPKNEQFKVRMMVPFSIRCLTCGEYIGAGKKFNARKETVSGEEYLGLKIFRFYFKCTRCSSEITIKTDPKNTDYACEMGAVRNFESQIKKDDEAREAKLKKQQEEEVNAMKAMESRLLDTREEMDTLDKLHEIRTMNARADLVDPLDVIDFLAGSEIESKTLGEDEEEVIREMIIARKTNKIKRMEDEVEDEKVVGNYSFSRSSLGRDLDLAGGGDGGDGGGGGSGGGGGGAGGGNRNKQRKSKIGFSGLQHGSSRTGLKFIPQTRHKMVLIGEAVDSDREETVIGGGGLVNY